MRKEGEHTQEFVTYTEIHSVIVEKEVEQPMIDWSYKHSDKEKCVVCAEWEDKVGSHTSILIWQHTTVSITSVELSLVNYGYLNL